MRLSDSKYGDLLGQMLSTSQGIKNLQFHFLSKADNQSSKMLTKAVWQKWFWRKPDCLW